MFNLTLHIKDFICTFFGKRLAHLKILPVKKYTDDIKVVSKR